MRKDAGIHPGFKTHGRYHYANTVSKKDTVKLTHSVVSLDS